LDRTARIVLLNGVGSAGKSSIAKALQAITRDVFLHVQMDAFFDMLPKASIGHPDGVTFETIEDGDHPSVIIRSGPLARRAFRGMRHAVAAMAAQGNDLIVDEVLLGETWTEYARLLAPFQVFLVGVHARLDTLEAREKARGDRLIGLARWQFDRVHSGVVYDLEVDTDHASPMECASLIKQTFNL
jgi:chloramphenicol 3-O phosphotransferase